jgi:hypothetical protein
MSRASIDPDVVAAIARWMRLVLGALVLAGIFAAAEVLSWWL